MNDTDLARLAAWYSKATSICYYLSLGIAIVGIAGNVLCVKVMGKVQKTVKGVRLIKYLAVVDTILLLLFLVYLIPRRMFDDSWNVYYVVSCMEFLLAPAFDTIKTIQVTLTVLIAVQRCLALTMPFRFKRIKRNSVLRKLLAGTLVFALLFNIPTVLNYKPLFHWNDEFQMTLIRSDYDANMPKKSKSSSYWTIIRTVLILGVPIALFVVCNIILIIARQRMTRIGPSGDRMKANQLTMIVIAVTAMSLVEQCLLVAQSVAKRVINLTPKNYTHTTTVFTLIYARDVIVCFNSATNFIFYCTFGREFRRTLIAMFKRRTPTHQPQQNVIALREIPLQGSEV